MKIRKEYRFEAAHRLPNHPGKCRNLHGHSYRIIATFSGDVKEDGMVLDFYQIDKFLKPIISGLDHSAIFCINDPIYVQLKQNNPDLKIYGFSFMPTAENLAIYIYNRLKDDLPIYSVTIYETEKCSATYEGD